MNSSSLLVTCLVFIQIFICGSGAPFEKMNHKIMERAGNTEDDRTCKLIGCSLGLCPDSIYNCCGCDERIFNVNLLLTEDEDGRRCVVDYQCFPATSVLSLENGKLVTMSELQIGDKVKTVSSDGFVMYSPVKTFLMKKHTSIKRYVTIGTSRNQTISLSENHLIYTRTSNADKFKPRYAGEVLIADEVLVEGNNGFTPVKVVSTSTFKIQGAFVPLTKEGVIVVDGVLASCYGSFDHDLAHLVMTPMRWFPNILEWIFGEENGSSGFVDIAIGFGKIIAPFSQLYKK